MTYPGSKDLGFHDVVPKGTYYMVHHKKQHIIDSFKFSSQAIKFSTNFKSQDLNLHFSRPGWTSRASQDLADRQHPFHPWHRKLHPRTTCPSLNQKGNEGKLGVQWISWINKLDKMDKLDRIVTVIV